MNGCVICLSLRRGAKAGLMVRSECMGTEGVRGGVQRRNPNPIIIMRILSAEEDTTRTILVGWSGGMHNPRAHREKCMQPESMHLIRLDLSAAVAWLAFSSGGRRIASGFGRGLG